MIGCLTNRKIFFIIKDMKNKQLSFLTNQIKTCAFTGHRELPSNFPKENLEKCVHALVEKGVFLFYCGMAKGFDLLAAETVIKEKEKNKEIKLVACIPCFGQEKSYSQKDKERYLQIIKNTDEKIIFGESFQKWKFLERNRFMADNADVLVAFVSKKTGGTAYTVSYFEKKYPEREIILIL